MQGRSLLPLLRHPGARVREAPPTGVVRDLSSRLEQLAREAAD